MTKITNKRGHYMVTDTYKGTDSGVLVTSVLHRVSGSQEIPRFGKTFRLDEVLMQCIMLAAAEKAIAT